MHSLCDKAETPVRRKPYVAGRRDAIRVGQGFAVPESNDLKALEFQNPRLIGRVIPVSAPINFDDQAMLETDEIHSIAANGELSPELGVSNFSGARRAPQPFLGLGGVSTGRTCAPRGHDFRAVA